MSYKTVLFFGSLLAAGQLHGACVAGSGYAIGATLNNRLVCAYKADESPSNANTRWSELHVLIGHKLQEWARGPSDPVDPTEYVGTWSVDAVSSPQTVSYSYDGGSTAGPDTLDSASGVTGYPWAFCTGNTTIAYAKFVSSPSGTNPCGWP